jgi:hypothetical protein
MKAQFGPTFVPIKHENGRQLIVETSVAKQIAKQARIHGVTKVSREFWKQNFPVRQYEAKDIVCALRAAF